MTDLKEIIGRHFLVRLPETSELLEVKYLVLTDQMSLLIMYQSGELEGTMRWCASDEHPVIVEQLQGLHGVDVPPPAYGIQMKGNVQPPLPPATYGNVQGPIQL